MATDPENVPAESGPSPRLPLPLRVLTVFAVAIGLWLFVFHGAPISRTYSRPTHALRAVLTTVLVVPAVLVAWRLLDRRPWTELGIPAGVRPATRNVLLGAACWAAPAALGLALCLVLGLVRITPTAPAPDILLHVAVLIPLVLLYEALPEELVFRGYLQSNLARALRPWQAIAAQAVLFTLFGFVLGTATTPDRILIFLAFALVLGVFRTVTGDIAAGIGFHVAYQTVAQLFVGERASFEVSDTAVFGALVLGGLPFALGWQAMLRLRGKGVDRRSGRG
ncbi:CPBP family intramembrane glutamic endopeptidase [Streptomyces sp. NPDC054863]